MPNKLKILLTFLILTLSVIILDISNVFAVDVISQSWKNVNKDNTKEDLLFRVYTTPHYTTVEKYITQSADQKLENGQWTYTYNGKTYTSKWVLNNTSLGTPSAYTFSSIGLAFHTSPMCVYTSGDDLKYNKAKDALDWNVNTIVNAVANSTAVATTPEEVSNYNESTFYKLYNTTGTVNNVSWGTGKRLTGLTSTGKLTEYRHAIITSNGSNIYIADNIVNSSDIPTLIKKIKDNKCTEQCYVSNILISQTLHGNGGYELAENSERFWDQVDKAGYTGWFWSAGMRGQDDTKNKAMGSVLNLYDNIIKFTQFSKRQVLVRHINIGVNTQISTSIVRKGAKITSNNLKLTLGNGDIITGTKYKNNDYQEQFQDIDIDQTVTKTALADTKTYKCIGYNVATASSIAQAKNQIDTKVNSGKFTKGTTVTVEGKEDTGNDEVVIIDFYYSEYDKDVYVNHVYVDKDGVVLSTDKQNIIPNDSATTTAGTTVDRKNTDRYSTEQYSKKLNQQIKTSIATSLQEDIDKKDIEYRGYKISNSKQTVASLVGTQVVDANMDKQVTLPDAAVTITYYYYKEIQRIEIEPKRDIEGKVFVEPEKGELKASCNDEESQLLVTSIPSGIKATTGITGIPKYMVGAITSHYTPPSQTQTMNVTLRFVFGDEEKTVKYTDLKYRVGYYTITDMLVYELQNATIYDAGGDNEDSIGDSIFDWEDGKFQPKINMPNLKVELKGIRGQIANNANAIANINNYVAVSITDNAGNTSSKGAANSSLRRVYLTTEQINTVDANVDGKINQEDITYSEEKLQQYLTALNNAKNVTSQKQSEYDNTVSTEASLKQALDNATTELATLKQTYDTETEEQNQKINSVNQINTDITTLKGTITTKEEEVGSKYTDLLNKEEEVREKSIEVSDADTYKAELYAKYEAAVQEENRLAALAQCIDEVDEETYESMTEEEKVELDQQIKECKENKQAYQEYVDSNIVSTLLQEHNSYEQGEYANLQNELKELEGQYSKLKTEYDNAVKALDQAKDDLKSKESLLDIATKDKEKHNKEEYLPAKEAYDSYNENEYTNAYNAYHNYVDAGHVTKAKQALDDAKTAQDKAQSEYDSYKLYKETLDKNYPEYKKLYDEFQSITGTNKEIAKKLGLKINIEVQNMLVEINDEVLGESKKNTATYTTSLYDYLNIDEADIPQITTEMPIISKDLYSGISSTYIDKEDYLQTSNIAKEVLNGVRALSGKADYTAKVVIGDKEDSQYKEIKDTVYYQDKSDENNTFVFTVQNKNISKAYKVNNDAETALEKYEQVDPVNIYTPITVSSKLTTSTSQIIDQRNQEESEDETQIIQINVPFTVNLQNVGKPVGYNTDTTDRFALGYYVKFDFDVHKVYINGKPYKNGKVVNAGTWIGMITKNKSGKAYITAQPYGNTEEGKVNIISEEKSSYVVRAVAYNATTSLRNTSLKFSSFAQMKASAELQDMINNICTKGTYFAEEEYPVAIINRAYDFRITDLKDLSWKSVFRKSSGNVTNLHTGNVYYSGTTKWDTTSEQPNNIITRSSSEIGRNPVRTLPLGPYKNTDTTYIKAPKLGYRFSFDMKVSGSYYYIDDQNNQQPRTDKKVAIGTSFYYISKDGKTFLEEYDGKKAGIYLFYKNSNGNYVRIDETGGGYELRFTPNDGYRYIEDNDKSTLSTKSLKLGTLRSITLNYQMATVTNTGSAITYYGEYKLPNSTIAVKVAEDGTYDINKPLTGGYIGVVFDIVAYAGSLEIDGVTQDVKLSYDADTQDRPNTSQWDYEGFLGYTTYGKEIPGNISLKLEKGKWNIDNEVYNKIKGTVILYDIDQRAATDYE